jgi:hypothetical protein
LRFRRKIFFFRLGRLRFGAVAPAACSQVFEDPGSHESRRRDHTLWANRSSKHAAGEAEGPDSDASAEVGVAIASLSLGV